MDRDYLEQLRRRLNDSNRRVRRDALIEIHELPARSEHIPLLISLMKGESVDEEVAYLASRQLASFGPMAVPA